MRLAEGPVTLRTPLLLLGLWVVLAPAQCSQGRPSWRYISSEVVIPRKELHHGKALLAAGWLSYSLRFGGQRHVLHMRRKRLFWPGQLVVMTQDDQGALQVDYPFFPLDCYYLGYLEDVPLSMVTVDTCYGGLEGIMKVDDLAYEIKPLKDSQRFEHIISQIVADSNAIGPMSTLGHKAERHPPLSDPNPSAASRISSKLYASHSGTMKGCLMSAHSTYTLYNNVSQCAQFLVHLDTNDCVCQRRATCIMYRYPVLTDSFSNCSFQHTQHIFRHYGRCLFEREIVYSNRSLTPIRCGNSVVEDKEQCDCGTFKQCYTNPCCDSDCSFTPGSICNRETCCTNCTYTPAGTLCRPIQNICDLPEYCNGKDTRCPSDFYLQDGTPCTEDGYCYHGNCTDRSMHCKEIFGEGALSAPDVCYSINRKGHRFGHCKVTEFFYPARCGQADVKCGRLQCVNVTHLPRLQEHVGFHHSILGGFLCFGVGAHRGTETTDVGAVRPGTPCGGGKFCLQGFCNATLAAIDYNCPPSKCNYRGVCNNNRNCHCQVGSDPPRCINTGAGGSVDSGPPPRRTRTVRESGMSVVYLRVVFGRLFALIAALLFGVATNVRTLQTTTITEVNVHGK
ncbi:hypothetical protein QTO34_008608 [Cnephaeus nilssonii]|uniref:Uncharacterized protein n=1 Tax=Cnephaeus nilssonii TaxID=3371016 RepID=A0AA40LWH7_CNENI|nr:hypothetical protein QTO34_008608 [Eptesicus nilssonii]